MYQSTDLVNWENLGKQAPSVTGMWRPKFASPNGSSFWVSRYSWHELEYIYICVYPVNRHSMADCSSFWVFIPCSSTGSKTEMPCHCPPRSSSVVIAKRPRACCHRTSIPTQTPGCFMTRLPVSRHRRYGCLSSGLTGRFALRHLVSPNERRSQHGTNQQDQQRWLYW